LIAPDAAEPTVVAPAVLDAFCDAFNARDLDRVTALLLDTTTVELPGLKVEYGRDAARQGTLRGTLFGCPDAHDEPPAPPRCEVRVHRGEPIFLWWWGDEVHTVVRVAIEDDRIAALYNYFHAPEVLAEICGELDVPFRAHGYRFW
jgi:RNA polymerase sigma-70 factor (ECF subfamily)